MNKFLKISIFIILIALIVLAGFFILNNQEKTNKKQPEEISKQKTEIIPEKATEIKTAEKKQEDSVSKEKPQTEPVIETDRKKNKELTLYTNSEIGISFKYPSYWKKNEVKSVDLNGKINAVEINFTDTISVSNFSVKYHPNPAGNKLYQYNLSQYKSSTGNFQSENKEIFIDGYKAISGTSVRERDGKGHKLNPPAKLTVVYLFYKNLKGELELNFRNNQNSSKSEKQFQQLLKTFKILNKN